MVVASVSDVGIPLAHAPRDGQADSIPFRRFAFAPLALMAVACVVLATGTRDVHAMGIGQATVLSSLGQPLRLSIPVTVQADEEIGCVQVRPSSDDLPSVFNVRTQVTRVGSQTRLEIVSAQSIDEPAIGLRVSVGCASAVSRDIVVFLDPPSIVSPVVAGASSIPRQRQRVMPTPVRREGATSRRSAAPRARVGRASVDGAPVPRERAPAARPPRAAIPTQEALPRLVDAPKEPDAAALAKAERDKLTVAPTEPSKVPALPTMATPAPAPAATPTASPPVPAPDAATGPAVVVPAEATPDEAAAREAQLRRDEAQLQERIKALSDQIAALRVQTTTLVTRNQELETNALAPWLVWLLIALALIGIAVAGWMSYRYVQLRRSLEGSPWWGGHTVLGPVTGDTSSGGAVTATGRASSGAGSPTTSRMQGTDVRSSATSSTPQAPGTSNVHGRSRPVARDPRYATSIDTDFTVSDIEAAMATVRTVSPTRSQASATDLNASDFAAYASAPAGTPVVDMHSVDLDIPPIPTSETQVAASIASNAWMSPVTATATVPQAAASKVGTESPHEAPSASPTAAPAEAPTLDFKLDLPATGFDPLSTDSMKTTIVDRADPEPDHFAPIVSALDFELPAGAPVAPLSAHETSEIDAPMRHGATALNDLFASSQPMGADTILALDERDDSPLSTTEVDGLVKTEVNDAEGSLHVRLVRFGGVVDQVDDIAPTDPARAISLLRQFVLRDERIPTLFWLKLFDLYRQVDKRTVYEALGEHFARRYQRPAPAWGGALADRAPQLPLSAMDTIDKAIEERWGTDECLEFMHALICDRDQPDAVVFDATLQRDLLDAAKVFPRPEASSVS